MKTLSLPILGACGLMALWCESILACSCIEPPPPLVAAENADVVFVGIARSVAPVDPNQRFSSLAVAFDVSEEFKGLAGAGEVTIMTGPDGALCGYHFEVGTSYLVYARLSLGEIWTGLCDRTRPTSRATEDLDALRSLPGDVSLGVEREGERLRLTVEGGESRVFELESSSDFTQWQALFQVAPTSSSFRISETLALTETHQFFRLREKAPSQGVFGVTLFLPGVCLEDPERPGECLNLPFPGSMNYDVRAFLDQPDLGRETPILESFQSRESEPGIEIPLEHAASLDDGTVTPALREVFARLGLELSDQLETRVQREGRTWLLLDLSDQQVFIVSRQTASLKVEKTGAFRVPLEVGEYCIWNFFGCDRQINVTAGEWQFHVLQVPLP